MGPPNHIRGGVIQVSPEEPALSISADVALTPSPGGGISLGVLRPPAGGALRPPFTSPPQKKKKNNATKIMQNRHRSLLKKKHANSAFPIGFTAQKKNMQKKSCKKIMQCKMH